MLSCINFEKLPSAKATAEQLSKEFDNFLSPYQIGQLWNVWLNKDIENRKSEAPTKQDILDIYADLETTTKQELFENETITNKEKVIDALQYLFFFGIRKLSGSDNITSTNINLYKDRVFSKLPDNLRKQGYDFIADNFKIYKEYFTKQRLSKLGVNDIDEDFEEKALKDNISDKSSAFIENKKNASDEVVWLIASLTGEGTAFGLPVPVDFENTWNILQNILGNSLTFEDQINVLKSYENKYPWIEQLLNRLGVTDNSKYSPELNKITASFTEAFSKQKSDIIVSSTGIKDSFSSIDGKTKGLLREKFKKNFFTSPFTKRVGGQIILNKQKLNDLKLEDTDEDLLKFIDIFGFKGLKELDAETRDNIKFIKKRVEASDNLIVWLDDKDLNVKGRVEKLLDKLIPLEQENKNLSAPNAEGKSQYSIHNHNYYSRITSKIRKGYIDAKNYFDELFSENKAETVIISGLTTEDNDEKSTFNNLGLSDIFTTLFSNMFSNNPIIHLPRTSDKSMERGFRIQTKNPDDILAFTKISPKLVQNIYSLFQSDSLDRLHPDWNYGVKNEDYMAFWNSLGINKGDTFTTFHTKLAEYIQSQREDTKNLLQNLGVIYKTNKWNYSFTNSPFNKIDFEKMSEEQQELFIDQMVDNFNFNMFYWGVGYTKSMYGSLVPVKPENMFKRFSAAVAEGRQVSISNNLASELSLDYKKQGFNYDPNTIKVIVHDETIESSSDKNLIKFSKKYKENNIDDAQGIITLPMYRTILKGANQWTDIQEEAYKDVMSGKQYKKNVFPPIKPVGYSLVDINGYKVPIYIKTSIYPISPADIKGLNNELKYDYAKQNDIGLFVPKSAIKMATPKNLKGVISEGQINDNPTFNFPIEDFRIQLDINVKDSTKQLQGTQQRKLLYTNLFENGKPLDEKYKNWLDENIDTLEKLADIERKDLYNIAGITETNNEGVISYNISNYNALKKLVKDELISREYPINTVESLNSIIDTDGNLIGTIDGLPSRQKLMNLLNAIVTNRLIKLYTNGTSLVQASQQGWEMKAESTIDSPTSIDFISKEAKQNYINNGGLAFFNLGEKTGAAEVLLPAKYKHLTKKDEDGNYIIDDEKVLINIGYRIPTQGHNSILHLKVVGFLPSHLDQIVILPKEITTQGGSDFDVDKLNLFVPNTITVDGKVKFINEDMNPEEVWNQLEKDKTSKGIDEATDKFWKSIFGDFDELEETDEEVIKSKENWIIKFTKKQLQNKLITQSLKVLEDPQIRTQLVTPNSADSLKEQSETLANELKENDIPTKKPQLNWSNLFNGITLGKTIYQMFASKALVGVFASQSTHHTLSQQVGLHFKSGRPFYFEHNKTESGNPDLSKIKGITGLVISDRLGNEYLTAAVDAAKDDYLTELGVNLQTGDIAALFERLGGNPEYLYRWINLPIIQEYLEKMKFNESLTAKETRQTTNKIKIIQSLLNDYGIKEKISYIYKNTEPEVATQLNDERDQRGNYSIEDIKDIWPSKNKTNNQLIADLLDDFLYFQDAALILRQSISTSKFDTAGPGKNLAESNLLKYKYDAFVSRMNQNNDYTLATLDNGLESPYTDLIFKTQLKVFYKSSFNFVNAIYQDLTVLQKNGNVKETFRLLVDPSNKFVKRYADSQEADIIYGAIVNYMIQNSIGYNESLFFGDNTLGHRIVKIQEDSSHPLHNNPIISDFFNIELSPSPSRPTIISPLIKSLSPDESSYYTGKLEELKDSDEELYNDLIKVSLFQTGVVQSPVSYYNQLPYYDVIPLVNDAIKQGLSDFKTLNSIQNITENIGSKLSNIKFENLKGSKLVNGILTLNKPTDFQIIRGIPSGSNKQQLFIRSGETTFQLIEPKNYKSLFYNFTSKSEQMEEEEIIESEDTESETILTFEDWFSTSEDVNPFESEEWNREYFNKCVKGK